MPEAAAEIAYVQHHPASGATTPLVFTRGHAAPPQADPETEAALNLALIMARNGLATPERRARYAYSARVTRPGGAASEIRGDAPAVARLLALLGAAGPARPYELDLSGAALDAAAARLAHPADAAPPAR